MVTKTAAYPDVAIPPGEYLSEEIAARGITQKELAKRMTAGMTLLRYFNERYLREDRRQGNVQG